MTRESIGDLILRRTGGVEAAGVALIARVTVACGERCVGAGSDHRRERPRGLAAAR